MASFYNSYMTSASQSPGAKRPEEDDPQSGPFLPGGTALPAWMTSTQGASAFGTQGAASPASQIQQTGNTGMQAKPAASSGGTTTPSPQSTTGTPSSATGSGLPPYGSNWAFNWSNLGGPGANTTYQAPTSLAQLGVDFSKVGYNPGFAPPPAWNAPGGNSSAALAALNAILSGDGSGMDTSALKNRLKEQRLIMEGDELSDARQAAASRGMLDSGVQSANERRIGSAARKDILGGFRDVDIAAAQAGVANKLAASGVLNEVLSGDTSRADVGFDNEMDRVGFMDDQARFGAQFGLAKENDALAAALGLEGLKQEGAATNLASWKAGTEASLAGREQEIEVAKGKTNELLGRMGLAVNLEEIARGSSRDKMQFLTDIFDILVRNEQFNAQMGFNYSQLGTSVNEMMANIAKSIGAV